MNVALELGVREFRSLRREGQRLIGRRCPCVYVCLPLGAAERKLLEQARISFSICRGSLLVLGHAALDLARSLKLPCLSPFEDNRFPARDGIARQVAAALIDAVLPIGNRAVDRCVLTVPQAVGNDVDVQRVNGQASTGATLAQFARLRGYDARVISSSHALGLAELGQDRLTGITIAFGAGKCQASLMQAGTELVQTGIDRGEDSLLDQWARIRRRFLWDFEGHTYLHQTAVREWKDQRQPSLENPVDDDSRVWQKLVRELVAELISETAPAIARHLGDTARRQPWLIVCSGALCLLPGFSSLLKHVLASLDWPVPCREIRISNDPNFAVARGLLIHAESMEETKRPLRDAG